MIIKKSSSRRSMYIILSIVITDRNWNRVAINEREETGSRV